MNVFNVTYLLLFPVLFFKLSTAVQNVVFSSYLSFILDLSHIILSLLRFESDEWKRVCLLITS